MKKNTKPKGQRPAETHWVDQALKKWAVNTRAPQLEAGAVSKEFEDRCRKTGLHALDGVRLAKEAERAGVKMNALGSYLRQLAERLKTRLKRPFHLDVVLAAHGIPDLEQLDRASIAGLASLRRLLGLPTEQFVRVMVRWDLLGAGAGVTARCRGNNASDWQVCREELDRLEAGSARRAEIRRFTRALLKACEDPRAAE